jgi:hypothetical protein
MSDPTPTTNESQRSTPAESSSSSDLQPIKMNRQPSISNGSTGKDPTTSAFSITLDDRSKYRSPLVSRYASVEMSYNFSEVKKFSTWRRLWFWLAKCQKVIKLTF